MNKIQAIYIFLILLVLSFSSCSILKKKEKTKDDPRIQNFNFNYYFLEANKQKILGNYGDALELYTLASKQDREDAATYYEIAGILNLAWEYSSALEYAKKAVKYDKFQNKYYLLLLANVYSNNNLDDEAIKVFEQLTKIEPLNINYYLKIFQLYKAKKKYSNALKILDKTETIFGISDYISLEKEDIYIKMGDTAKAIVEIEKLSNAYPESTKNKILLAETYANLGKIKEAEEIYDEVYDLEIGDDMVYFSIADFYFNIGKNDRAFYLINKGILSQDVDLSVKLNLVLALLNTAQTNKTVNDKLGEYIEALVVQYPDEIVVRVLKSDYLLFLGDYKNAQKEYDFILKTEKDKMELWKQAISIDAILQDMEALYTHSKEAVELYPLVLEFYQYFIVSAYANEKFTDVVEAVEFASPYVEKDFELYIDFLSMQADAFYKLEDFHKSDSVFDLILYKDSENIQALNNYSYFLALRKEKLDKALEMSEKLMVLSPNKPSFLDTHAWVLFENKKYEEALIYINKALIQDSTNSTFLEHKGDILFKLNKLDQALEFWEEAYKNNSGNNQLKEKIKQKKILD
ncbi:MAG: tetratricopeptide repeat protein [Bacteroidales bacterium]|jgi:tetratricopeptide (TPR) repeat protein|nr:tetratricopeptide repeat protein [Bacteroidales bacterium]MDY0314131.1 CDC27 family protein [Bacteroidales bacterium]NLB87111.1 tetratricopeptide repeat protein [Bacteroidales bacterium]